MEKTITFSVLSILLVFIVGFLGYLFLQYVKSNIELFKTLNVKLLGKAILYKPRTFLLFIFSVGLLGWSIGEMWKSGSKSYVQTKATITNIVLSERTVNNEPEEFLQATYEFQVEGNTYEAYEEFSRYTFMSVEKQKEEIRSMHETKNLFYNSDNPYEVRYNEGETGASKHVIVFISAILLILFSYWLIMEIYKYFLSEN